MASETKYRIFLASPGDVQDERNIARAVIDQIRHERAFRDRLNIEVVAWDQPGASVAMDAGLTPQEAIKQGLSKPSECDLVVIILWARMGTPLPQDEYSKEDGSPYLSGTEWEYEDAMTAPSRPDRPAVWVYRRTQIPAIGLEDPTFDEKLRQWDRVKSFLELFKGSDGSLKGSVNNYETPDGFQNRFEAHLRDHLTKFVEILYRTKTISPPAKASQVEPAPRFEGSPYPGLEAFDPEQAAIFFGRTRETDKLIELLRDPGLRFLAVVGASGSGKSSLVAAGLIPRLRAGALPGSIDWRDISFKPGERADGEGNCPFLSLAYALKTVIGKKGHRASDLAQDLRADPTLVFELAEDVLENSPPAAELILFIDQFEELFTLVANKDRQNGFISLLKTIVEKSGSRVRTIVTMRSDFTENVTDNPALVEVFQDKSLFLLAVPGERALEQMILKPARVAGIEVGDTLCERILKDTGTGPGALALMAFTLGELYKHGRTDTGSLSMAYYENELGGVQGAIDKQAETAIGRIKRGRGFIEGKLHELFFDLVEVNDQGVATRRRASKAKIDRDPAKKKLTASLVEARILVTGHETASTCEMAHEAIFTGWLRLAKWIEANADAMRICRNLRIAAGDWKAKGASALRYLPDGATLRQYRRVNDKCRYEKKEDEAAVGRYLAAARRRRQMVGLLLALAVIIGSMLGLDSFRNSRDMSWSAMQIWGLAKAGIYEGPLMVTVPAGCFVIGCVDESSYCRKEQKRYPQVCLDTFEMSRHEVTQDLWTAIMGNNPAYFKEAGGRHPVEQVSWGDTLKFIRRLNELTGKQFRLPTEAEWEYAARSGGKDQTYAGGDDFDELGWSLHNSGGMTHPVGQKRPNGLGLYDMSGNVWEWVEDEWHRDYEGAPTDGSAWLGDSMGFGRVVRGGGLNVDAGMCRSTSRYHYGVAVRYGALGFRLARSVNLDR